MTNKDSFLKLINAQTIININKICYIQKTQLHEYSLEKNYAEIWFSNGKKLDISYQDYLDLIKEIDFL